jgi:hypothetical protein
MSGHQWLHERSRLGFDTPVLVVTSYPGDLTVEDVRVLGAIALCEKPIQIWDLGLLLATSARRPMPLLPVGARVLEQLERLQYEVRIHGVVAADGRRAFLRLLLAVASGDEADVRLALPTARYFVRLSMAGADWVATLDELRPALERAAVPRDSLEPRLAAVLDRIEHSRMALRVRLRTIGRLLPHERPRHSLARASSHGLHSADATPTCVDPRSH